METILQDVRYSVRLLRRHRGSSLVAIATLAVAIGVSTALFSVIDAALLHPLPYPHPEELVEIGVGRGLAPSIEEVRAWRASGILTHVGMGRVAGFMSKIVDAGAPERLTVGSATEDFLETYGVTPWLGRLFTLDDTREGALPVALLGHAYWRKQFGGDERAVGRAIRIDNKLFTIVGVVPPTFYRSTDVWEVTPASNLSREGSGTPTVGRLRPGVTIGAAAEQMAPMLGLTPAATDDSRRVKLVSLYDTETSGFGATIWTLSDAVGLILTIACVNVAGLLLARGAVRRPELAIRASIGASRGRLIRQQVIESVVLSIAAGATGVLLAFVTLDALVSLIPLSLPANAPPAINATTLAFALVLSVVTALIFSLVPAFRLSRVAIGTQLITSNRRHGSALTRRGSNLLVGAEVALAVVLLAGAGLLVRSFERLMSVGVGYDTSDVITMEVQPLAPTPALNADFYPALLTAVRGLPEVAAAGAVDDLTIRGGTRFSSLKAPDGTWIGSPQRQILPGYFEALGLHALQGRLPNDSDLIAAESAVLVNESAAKKYFPATGALGIALESRGGKDSPPVPMRIVGVVPDIRFSGPQSGATPEFYLVPQRKSMDLFGLAIRFRPGQSVSVNRLRSVAEAVGPRAFVGKITWATDAVGDRVASRRHRMLLLGLLGALGLGLTLVGILTMTAYAVAQRTQEVGVRMAFGAPPSTIVFGIVRETAWPIAIGMVAGLAAAFYATQVIAKFLYQTTPRDALTFTLASVVMAATGCVAAWLPARRAASVDPVAALRAD